MGHGLFLYWLAVFIGKCSFHIGNLCTKASCCPFFMQQGLRFFLSFFWGGVYHFDVKLWNGMLGSPGQNILSCSRIHYQKSLKNPCYYYYYKKQRKKSYRSIQYILQITNIVSTYIISRSPIQNLLVLGKSKKHSSHFEGSSGCMYNISKYACPLTQ